MDNLRLILFISGILVIAAIYAWEIFRERRSAAKPRDIFDDDVSGQNNPNNTLHDNAEVQQYREQQYRQQLDRIAMGGTDEVVPGDRDTFDRSAFDNYDTRNDLSATVFDAPRIVPMEKAPMDRAGIAEEVTAEEATAEEVAAREMIDLDPLIEPDAPPAEKNRTEKRSEKARASINQEKDRSGKTATGNSTGDGKELVLGLTIIARSGRRFMGPDILTQFENVGMHLGDMQVFHYFGTGKQKTDQSIFIGADILEPGVFPAGDLENHTTRGVVLFMQLPGPLDGLVAFEQMLDVAQRLAKSLDGELCDLTRSTLTTQSANHLRERIEEMKRKQLV
uniref:Cell division protein ZipA n=1 Tax=Candidatus Kentrum sp. FM TaxID=2126340 RepID=A0A450TSZ5_9GAMM|nr:MAG: cell division protein ZipA [Candidatus Kentron sp. FM]VFJ71687.1 MAG: cell division protein ZipA [Candidatus Kentron sp. FM]VFK11577.1 MAG: cell division protein ZipA [Candidatus Kentron sp. FM]